MFRSKKRLGTILFVLPPKTTDVQRTDLLTTIKSVPGVQTVHQLDENTVRVAFQERARQDVEGPIRDCRRTAILNQ